MDVVYQRGQATAAEVLDALPDPPSYSAVRALLRVLEEKGHLRHRRQGPRYVFLPTVSRETARRSALARVVRTFFDGSTQATVAALIWAAGAMALAAWSLAGIRNTRRLTGQASPVTSREWLDALRDACASLEIRCPVRLLQSVRVAMPMTWGWRRPVILVPAASSGWTPARHAVVLRHELAHVKRADVVTPSLAQWACAIYWFNPVVWFAAFRLRVERERACDDEVLRLGTRASDYANHLLDIARECHRPAPRASAAVAMARPSQLENRMRAILDPTVQRGASRYGFDDWHRVAQGVFDSLVWHLTEARRTLGGTPASAQPTTESSAAASRMETEQDDDAASVEARREPPGRSGRD